MSEVPFMPEFEKRLDQPPSTLAAALATAFPARRAHPVPDQVATDDRWIEALRAGHAHDAQDPVIRWLARWRATIVEGT